LKRDSTSRAEDIGTGVYGPAVDTRSQSTREDASDAAGEIYDRATLILPPDRIDGWLDPSLTELDKVKKRL
jgi:hypothetical protein